MTASDDVLLSNVPALFADARLDQLAPALLTRLKEHWAADFWLFGRHGHGKSHCAGAVLIEKLRDGRSAYWWNWPNPIDPVWQAYGPTYSLGSVLRQVDLLVVDALTRVVHGDMVDPDLADLIRFRRARGRQTIVVHLSPPPPSLAVALIDVTGRNWGAEQAEELRRLLHEAP